MKQGSDESFQAVLAGEEFDHRVGDGDGDGDGDSQEEGKGTHASDLPNPMLCLIPLVAVLACSFFLHPSLGTSALIVALLSGVATLYLLQYRYFKNPGQPFTEGATGALVAIANTCAVVGFGAVAKVTPAFTEVVAVITNLPGGGLVGAAIAITVICGLTGSASGGQTIALPLLGPLYIGPDASPDQRVDPEALHRVVSIASGGLDSLPHNGYVVTLIRAICGETHQDAYWPLAKLTVVVPVLGAVAAIGLFVVVG